MAIARRLRRAFFALLAVFGILLWFVALLLFTRVTENSDDFARLQNWIVPINSVGIAVLLVLIVVNLAQLIRDYRRHVPGSRLRARMVTVFVMVAITPLVGVYIFSVEFINRGIDNWFNIDVDKGLADVLKLGQTAFDIQSRSKLEEAQRLANRLSTVERRDLVSELSRLRVDSSALELTLYGPNSQILATTAVDSQAAVPKYPSEEVLFQLRQSQMYVSIEPQANGLYQIIAAAPLGSGSRGELEFLQAIFPMDPQLGTLANAVQASLTQLTELQYLRTALKYAFTLTLSLVLLISLLASVYGAFFFARRLVVPIQLLMQGTRAVARGDFATRVPTPTPMRDEIGFLVHSFNDMTQRLAKASEDARLSQNQVESERRKLEVILARLSTGVIALEPDLRIRTANQAAGAILGADLDTHVGESLADLASSRPLLAQFLTVAAVHLERGDHEWREQIALRGDSARRVLMCACTELPGEADGQGGYVIVFDDITALLQAQRDAAWGEVARRLAHEIKNPLTPIQLSAERLRRKYLKAEGAGGELLDRATHTIIQQVEAMKQMVNAFSEYARTPTMEVTRFDVNALIAEVSELYAHQENPLAIKLSLNANLPLIEADAGRLRQVLHNLLRNALEATEHQAEAYVEISTRRIQSPDADFVEIGVTDNGPGFLDDIVHQAFDPYVTSKPKGTGLGLAIVKKLIEEHGGQIVARNREQGGAEISILIPTSVDSGGHSMGRRQDHNRRERA
jgi:nitrogen fixation/metabolism regulation signal transduction histidine kinase